MAFRSFRVSYQGVPAERLPVVRVLRYGAGVPGLAIGSMGDPVPGGALPEGAIVVGDPTQEKFVREVVYDNGQRRSNAPQWWMYVTYAPPCAGGPSAACPPPLAGWLLASELRPGDPAWRSYLRLAPGHVVPAGQASPQNLSPAATYRPPLPLAMPFRQPQFFNVQRR